MITLDNFDLASLMKNKLAQTEEDAAFFNAIESMLKHVHAMKEFVVEKSEVSEELLDIKAIESNVDLYDSNLTFEQKMNLVEKSEYLKRRKGTRGALESALFAIYSDAKIYEWFEYGGEPFHFKIEIPMPESMSKETNDFLLKVVNMYKRTTAVLDGINFYTEVYGTNYRANAQSTLERITVYPKEV